MRTAIAIAVALLLGGCSRAAPEPEQRAERTAAPVTQLALVWHAPASWNLEKSAGNGLYRAKYIIPAQGDASNPAELLVTSIGAGAAAELDKPLAELRGDFEGPEVAAAPVRARQSHGFELRELEVPGTYKFPVGPRVGKRVAATVMKERWRALGAGVRTPSGQLWFFRLVGPDDAVLAARSPFTAMFEQLEER